MKSLPRVVLDTNVFISCFILSKVPHPIVEAWQKERFVWILSQDIQDEYLSVIGRPKFCLTIQEVENFSNLLERAIGMGLIEKVESVSELNVVKEDPKDNKFLECAIAGEADYIVSGDHHLLNLQKYKNIRMISLREFLKAF